MALAPGTESPHLIKAWNILKDWLRRRCGVVREPQLGIIRLEREKGTAQCTLKRSARVNAPGLVNFVSGLAYHLCLNLRVLVAFTQPGASNSSDNCAYM